MAKTYHEQAGKLYEQILDLLEEIAQVSADADLSDDEEEGLDDHEITDMMIEEAVERGMDDESVEKVFKAISQLARKAREA